MKRLALLLVCAACTTEGTPPARSAAGCEGFAPGALVVSEIMANPHGAENGQEWFEIYNPGPERDLTGLTVLARRVDGSREKRHVIDDLIVGAGGRVVLGNVLDELRPAHVDRGYADQLGNLGNGSGDLALVCGDVVVDRVVYGEVTDGASLSLSGGVLPDAQGNDEPSAWCDAQSEHEPGARGTPGATNDVCPGAPVAGCEDGGVWRPVVSPAPGELRLSEILPNPAGIADDVGEWIELEVLADVDLNGLSFGKSLETPTAVLSGECLSVRAGDRVVVQRVADPARNGGLPAGPIAALALGNSSGTLVVSLAGQRLDEARWGATSDGVAFARDEDGSWCKASTNTPGAANPRCPVAPGQCEEESGARRAIVPPAPGQLVITEVLADTLGAEDPAKEWFEVLALADVDLNDLELGKKPPAVAQRLSSPRCLAVLAGTRLVFAGALEANGGLPRVDVVKDFALAGANGGVWLGVDGEVVDSVAWPTSIAGVARQLDERGVFCPAEAAYGREGYRGTPGAPNQVCP